MAEENKIKSRTYIPKVYYKGELLPYKETPLTVKDIELCKHCKEEITLAQIQHIIPKAEKVITDKILVYLNQYRKDYKLDTCLRKAHFIAQVGTEMGFVKSNIKENHNYNFSNLSKKYFSDSQVIDNTILTSLKKYLKDIFKIIDKSGKEISKTNVQLEKILKDNKVTVDVRKLYGKYKLKELTIKEVKEKVKDKTGKEVEELKFKIILKKHNALRMPFFSRFYATYPNDKRGLGNGNELSREGFIFCGKGIKQLTGKANYVSFSNFRKNNPFPKDPKTYIDFTKITDKVNYTGNFDLLADTKDVIYGVQSALWFYQKGGVSIDKKYAFGWADEDDIKKVTRIINGGYNGLENRKNNTLKAREDKAFKVYKHYEETHKNGSKEIKKEVEDKLIELASDTVYRKVNFKDVKAETLLKKLRKVKPISTVEPKGIKLQSLIVDSNIILRSIENEQ